MGIDKYELSGLNKGDRITVNGMQYKILDIGLLKSCEVHLAGVSFSIEGIGGLAIDVNTMEHDITAYERVA